MAWVCFRECCVSLLDQSVRDKVVVVAFLHFFDNGVADVGRMVSSDEGLSCW